jgi:hypothetical protein
MHGVLVTANIAAGQFEAARQGLHEQVLPRVKQAPGLVKGFWTRNGDGTQGISLVVFDTKEHAEGAANMVRTTPPPPGVTLAGVEVREVVADA